MSSNQARRESTTAEREIRLEKDRVPKITSHFESLAKDAESGGGVTSSVKEPQFESLVNKVGKQGNSGGTYVVGKVEMRDSADEEGLNNRQGRERGRGDENKELSLDEISQLRNTAQQKSAEAISGAQDRYEKAKKKTNDTARSAANIASQAKEIEENAGDYEEDSKFHGAGEGKKGTEEADSITKIIRDSRESGGSHQESQQWQQQQHQEGGSSVLGAIGETIKEIAEATKGFVIWDDQPRAKETDAYKVRHTEYEHCEGK